MSGVCAYPGPGTGGSKQGPHSNFTCFTRETYVAAAFEFIRTHRIVCGKYCIILEHTKFPALATFPNSLCFP